MLPRPVGLVPVRYHRKATLHLLAPLLLLIITAGCGVGSMSNSAASQQCPGSMCGGRCTDVDTDRANCGVCGRQCAAGEICTDGVCTLSCQDGLTVCSGTCRDLATDGANCGACGNRCATGATCVSGSCACVIAGMVACGAGAAAACSDLQTDSAHCGNCDTSCASDETCVAGACQKLCSTRGATMTDASKLADPGAGQDQQLLDELRATDTTHVFSPSTITWPSNALSSTREMTLAGLKHVNTVRWGPNAWEQADATLQASDGTTLHETWTIGWRHLLGASDWATVGAVAPLRRIGIDQAAALVMRSPQISTNPPPPFPTSKVNSACMDLVSDSLTDFGTLLTPDLLAAVNYVNTLPFNQESNQNVTWQSCVPTTTVTVGSATWTQIRVTYVDFAGMQFTENWIMKWVFEGTKQDWLSTGFVSSIERERLGVITQWWTTNRTKALYDLAGPYGRYALVHYLTTNNTGADFSYSATDVVTQQYLDDIVAAALQNANQVTLPSDATAAVGLLADYLAQSYVNGSWQYLEPNYLTAIRIAEKRQGHCELNIVLSALLESQGIRARYVTNSSSASWIEAWVGQDGCAATGCNGYRTFYFDQGNTTWAWQNLSVQGETEADASTSPELLVYFCDPHAYCTLRRLVYTPAVDTLFTTPHGLACLDPDTFDFNQVSFIQ